MGKEITNVSIDILKVHPRNTEFFDDISGSEYEEFKNSIKEEGIISEIIVSPDMTIISGHQRYKAAKELGIKIVPIRIREDLIDEDKKLKVLLAANFGRSKNDDKKQRKVAVEYVKLCGYKHGEIGNGREKNSQVGNSKLSLDEIAKQLGTSKTNLTRALSIERNLTEPMKQLLDDGIISKTVASDLIASLSEDEQIELISSMDTTKKITKNEVQKYINEINQLKSQSAKEKIIDKTDYDLENKYKEAMSQISNLKTKINNLEIMNSTLKSSNESSESLLQSYKKESEEYIKLKNDIATLNLDPSGDYNVIEISKDITTLVNEIEKLLSTTLSPLRYSKILPVIKDNTALRKNLENIIYMVNDWCETMAETIGVTTNKNIIDMEELN
ncbi:MAG: ParB/RepB/Spo0J family partition protein [Peptostreptococcaceae bacterium]|jgi:ParB-like chromosome segregation protein Spo0J|nr:ParB/RepB/Spo0J family partition protein [Peptostreptococcaceae bacterium]DAF71050.1 MAG TPA: chromosome partitioning protein [Caudoviricetes sp.]DAQ24541.1 MAG TPA: chromosome partitioning protein [Caudoviricetes sp.]